MYIGDYRPAETLDLKFTTKVNGIPTTLAGTPVLSIYKANGTTETTVGITLTVDFDGRTGLNHARIVASDAFYTSGDDYQLVVTTGTLNGTSIAGSVVAHFSLKNRTALRPVIAERELAVETDGHGHADLKEWLGVAPNALVANRVDTSVGAMAANVLTAAAINAAAITAAKFATDALNANALAADAVAEIVDGMWDEDIVAAHGTAGTAGLLLRALGSAISLRANNPTLDGLLGVVDAAGRDLPEQVWLDVTRVLTAATNITSTGGTTVPQTGDSFARIGAGGANLGDLGGMSTAMRAEIEAEVNDALVALHLDHLLAVDYDPAAKPGVATALLNELVEDNGGVSRLTAAALDQVWAVATRILTAATNITSTGGTTVPQTGDSFPLLPGTLVGGRMDSDVGAMQAGVITAAVFAAAAITAAKFGANAIDANALANDAALEIADALLNRDMSAVSDTNSRTPLNALRKLMNKWAIVGTTLTVNKEDDVTPAYTQTLTADASANPITSLDTV